MVAMSMAVDSLIYASRLVSKYPIILAPLVAPFIVQVLFALVHLGTLGSIVTSIISFIALALIVQMLDFVAEDKPVDIYAAWNILYKRIDDVIITSFLAALLALTVVLIPAALYSIIVMVADREKPVRSVVKAFRFIIDNFKEVLVLIVIAIIIAALAFVLSMIVPVIGIVIYYALSLVISAVICLAMATLYYFRVKKLFLGVLRG